MRWAWTTGGDHLVILLLVFGVESVWGRGSGIEEGVVWLGGGVGHEMYLKIVSVKAVVLGN